MAQRNRIEKFAKSARKQHFFQHQIPYVTRKNAQESATKSRNLRKKGLLSNEAKLWSRHGSTRYLWTERHIEIAVEYVIDGQCDELPNFE